MLMQVADGVLVHQSEFMQSNAVVVHGRTGVLLVDAGVQSHELRCLADDIRESGRSVDAGFSTHPHWDHLLWDVRFGTAPRYGTARCAATARERLSDPGVRARLATLMPPEIADQVPLDLLGDIEGLAAGTTEVPWDGPRVRIIEHQAHAPGHASLFVEERGVLVAGDMLSDLLIPMLDQGGADPAEDYLAALGQLEQVAGDADVVVPGHGTVGRAGQVRTRIDLDRAYVRALAAGETPADPRIDPATAGAGSPNPGVHERQRQR